MLSGDSKDDGDTELRNPRWSILGDEFVQKGEGWLRAGWQINIRAEDYAFELAKPGKVPEKRKGM